MATASSHHGWRDVRLSGFADRAKLAEARRWLDATRIAPGSEAVACEEAAGRILAADVAAKADLPPFALAAADGYAVRAADTEGASTYNALLLTLSKTGGAGRASLVFAGARLPSGSDTILRFEATARLGSERLEVLEAAAEGEGIAARGNVVRADEIALPAGRRLRPQDLALLRTLGVTRVSVLRRPRIGLVIAGPKGAEAEALGPMLSALVGRDGGDPTETGHTSLSGAIAAAGGADAILIAGRSSVGEDDVAPLALTEAGGTIALHGLALRPGGSSGLGRLGRVPVLLLPGAPAACFCAYEFLAGRLIRGMAGLAVGLPYPTRTLPLRRKIVSAIGFTEMVQVAVSDGRAYPIGAAEGAALAASCRADGFVVVEETLEGHAEGDSVRVYLYHPA